MEVLQDFTHDSAALAASLAGIGPAGGRTRLFGALFERRIGRIRLFINAENLGNIRQTRYDPLLRPERAPDGRWTVDAWAPLDGRVINGGLRITF